MNELHYKAVYMITNHSKPWYSWHRKGVTEVIEGLGTVRVVEAREDTRSQRYGEYDQGSEGDLGITFEVTTPGGETVFVHKEGSADSYGAEAWNGGFYAVQPQEKPVTLYERV